MSAVIDFTLRPQVKKAREEVSGPAEVIIFPGVRFERIEFDESIFEAEDPPSPHSDHPQSRNRAAKS